MEFKNLAEVTQLTEVPEGASVLAATAEGEVVRVPGDGLGGGGGGFTVVDCPIGDDGNPVFPPVDDLVEIVSSGATPMLRIADAANEAVAVLPLVQYQCVYGECVILFSSIAIVKSGSTTRYQGTTVYYQTGIDPMMMNVTGTL